MTVSFGEYLKSQRAAAGVSLEEIAAETRISVRMLGALEEERFEELPGGVFNLSFVRQYARQVGLDEDEAAKRFKSIASTTTPLPFSAKAREAKDPYLARTAAARLAEAFSNFLDRRLGAMVSLTVGLMLVLGGLYFYQSWEPAETAAPSLAAQADGGETAPIEGSRAGESPLAALRFETPRPAMPIELDVEITDTVWIRALADGRRVYEGTFRAGQRKPISARETISLNVGNAGGVRLALNGRVLGSLGPRGHVRRILVTVEGVEILYASPKPQHKPEQADREATVATRASAASGEVAWARPDSRP